jgi:uncharacterized Fe-S cluster-containing radical SAM superfamily protein
MDLRAIHNIRKKVLDLKEQKVLIANLNNTLESKDDYTRINCKGYGRIRVFKNFTIHMNLKGSKTRKPLYRGHPEVDELKTQVFQLSGCNWRCWYCFVDYKLLSGQKKYGRFCSTDELMEMFLQEPDRANVIDLSGGNPDIVPEWCLWMMRSIEKYGLKNKVHLWLDDNLGTSILWEVLTKEEIEFMANFPKHSRACCFKGFDQASFEFNTGEQINKFDIQFEIFRKLLKEGFDLYAYATLTAPKNHCTKDKIVKFVDRLQDIHPNLPLRTIPLEIRPYTAMAARMKGQHEDSLIEQNKAYYYWWEELTRRYSSNELEKPYDKIELF